MIHEQQDVQTVTATSFKSAVLEARDPVAVEFMSYGCSHCRTIEPFVREVARDLAGREAIVRVNVAVDADLAAGYAVLGTPTFVMFSDGAEVGRVEGPSPTYAGVFSAVTGAFSE
jgi:thioredoxin 1